MATTYGIFHTDFFKIDIKKAFNFIRTQRWEIKDEFARPVEVSANWIWLCKTFNSIEMWMDFNNRVLLLICPDNTAYYRHIVEPEKEYCGIFIKRH